MALNISYNFVDGSPLNATQVNQNFEDIVNAIQKGKDMQVLINRQVARQRSVNRGKIRAR